MEKVIGGNVLVGKVKMRGGEEKNRGEREQKVIQRECEQMGCWIGLIIMVLGFA